MVTHSIPKGRRKRREEREGKGRRGMVGGREGGNSLDRSKIVMSNPVCQEHAHIYMYIVCIYMYTAPGDCYETNDALLI